MVRLARYWVLRGLVPLLVFDFEHNELCTYGPATCG
jgi:hypothetical protein